MNVESDRLPKFPTIPKLSVGWVERDVVSCNPPAEPWQKGGLRLALLGCTHPTDGNQKPHFVGRRGRCFAEMDLMISRPLPLPVRAHPHRRPVLAPSDRR